MKADSLGFKIGLAAQVWRKIKEGNSIEKAIGQVHYHSGKLKAAVQSIVFFTTRKRALIDWIVKELVQKKPQEDVLSILEISLGLLNSPKENAFTVVNQAVQLTKESPSTRSTSNFVNAVLRRYLREKEQLLKRAMAEEEVKFNAPNWWIEKYKAVFGKETEKIFALQNIQPPMTLRVNRRKTTPTEMLVELLGNEINAKPVGRDGLILCSPLPVEQIPGFREGKLSVQDAGSQLAAQLLGAKNGMKVLDACAAPGGKTAHILELADVDMLAIEINPERAKSIRENMDRLGLKAEIKVADAGKTSMWWDGKKFDRILLDAPCTASGIVRRHPDIPWLRRPEDIKSLAQTQQFLIEKLWSLLTKGGRMLYSVCSVFDEEGPEQIQRFIERTDGCKLIPIGKDGETLLKLWPEQSDRKDGFWPSVHDGFFYALIEKV